MPLSDAATAARLSAKLFADTSFQQAARGISRTAMRLVARVAAAAEVPEQFASVLDHQVARGQFDRFVAETLKGELTRLAEVSDEEAMRRLRALMGAVARDHYTLSERR